MSVPSLNPPVSCWIADDGQLEKIESFEPRKRLIFLNPKFYFVFNISL